MRQLQIDETASDLVPTSGTAYDSLLASASSGYYTSFPDFSSTITYDLYLVDN